MFGESAQPRGIVTRLSGAKASNFMRDLAGSTARSDGMSAIDFIRVWIAPVQRGIVVIRRVSVGFGLKH
jgi:hypothetical protein